MNGKREKLLHGLLQMISTTVNNKPILKSIIFVHLQMTLKSIAHNKYKFVQKYSTLFLRACTYKAHIPSSFLSSLVNNYSYHSQCKTASPV